MEKILPCPFCGCEAELNHSYKPDHEFIRCVNCGAQTEYFSETNRAVNSWNSRALNEIIREYISACRKVESLPENVYLDPPKMDILVCALNRKRDAFKQLCEMVGEEK